MYNPKMFLAATLLFGVLPAAGFAKPSPTIYHFCLIVPEYQPLRVYFSNIFETETLNTDAMKGAFADFVKKKYSDTGSVSCGDFENLEEATAQLKGSHEALANKARFIETGWKWTKTD